MLTNTNYQRIISVGEDSVLVQKLTDKDWSQKLTLSILSSGELKNVNFQICAPKSQITVVPIHLSQHQWAGVDGQDCLGDVRADVLQLQQLVFPHLEQAHTVLVHLYPTHPFLMERKYGIKPVLPEIKYRI